MTDSQSLPIDRRRDLMAAARVLFQDQGFAKTPVSAIVRKAGVSQGTFYLYFKSKQELLADLRRDVLRNYAAILTKVAALECPADEKLVRVVVAMADAVRSNLDLETMFRFAESGEDSLRAVREGRQRLALVATSFLIQGVDSGVFTTSHPERHAGFIVTLFDQILFETAAFEPTGLQDVLTSSVHFVLGALGVPPTRIVELIEQSPQWRSP